MVNFIVNSNKLYSKLLKHLLIKCKLSKFYEKLNDEIKQLKIQYGVNIYFEHKRAIVDTYYDIVINVEQTSCNNKNNYFVINFSAYKLGNFPAKYTIRLCELLNGNKI